MKQAADLADQLRGTVIPFPDSLVRQRVEEGKAIEALALRMAGLTYPQIADRLSESGPEVSVEQVRMFLERKISRAVNRGAEDMRELENLRLDRLQAAIWTDALKGDPQAVHAYLQISTARRRMNGLDEPKKIAISANVHVEMQRALEDLKTVVLGTVVHEAVEAAEDEDDDDDDY